MHAEPGLDDSGGGARNEPDRFSASVSARLVVLTAALVALSAIVPAISPRVSGAGPTVNVSVFRQETWTSLPHCRLYTEGLLRNDGPGLAGETDVHVSAVAPDGAVLGRGRGKSWLGVLAPGEEGPFSAATSLFDCGSEVGEIRFDITTRTTTEDRYRGLAVDSVALRDLDGAPTLFGELANVGPEFLNLGDVGSSIYLGFFSGQDLVELAAAKLPKINTPGRVGQPHPPGFRYPWSAVPPDKAYDRWVAWAIETRFPPDVYPVPLGARNVKVDQVDDGVRMSAVVYNCGVEAAADVLLVAAARDPDGGVKRFAHGILGDVGPILPGGEQSVDAEWLGLGSAVAPGQVEVHPFALQSQSVRPGLVPCSRQAGRLALPALGLE